MSSAGIEKSEFLQQNLKAFFARHPGVDVEWRFIPWNRAWHHLMQALKQQDLPDVVQVGSSWLPTLARLNVFDTVPDGVVDGHVIAPWVRQAAEYEGKQWAVPWFLDCNLLVARVDVMETLRLSPGDLEDWEGFLTACRRVEHAARNENGSHKGLLPVAVHYRPDLSTLHWATPWLWSGGWQIPLLNGRSSVRLLSDETAFQGLRQLARVFHVSPAAREMANASTGPIYTDFFCEGRYAFYTGQSGGPVRELDPSFQRKYPWPFILLPIPKGPAGSISRGGASLLAVTHASRDRQMAWELVRHLSRDALVTARVAVGGEVPAYDCTYWQAKDDIPFRRLLHDTLQTTATYPSHPLWGTIESVLIEGMSALLWHYLQGGTHDDTARQIARQVDRRITSLLDLGWDVVP